MDPHDFLTNIIFPTLEYLSPDIPSSETAARLLLGTAITESGLSFLVQHPGPALSVYQIEPRTHNDIWKNFLSYNTSLSSRVRGLAGARFSGTFIPPQELVGNLYYATAIARIVYFRSPKSLPMQEANAMSLYYKEIYNTYLGKADSQRVVSAFEKALKA